MAINELQERTCTIHNDGADPLLLAPALVEGDDFVLVGDTSEFLLPAGATHDLAVRFSSGNTGAQLGRVVFGQPAAPDLLLRGTVLLPSDGCAVTLDGSGNGDCGALAVGFALTRTALIRNTGTETLAGDISLVGDLDAFTVTAGGGWTTLPPGGLHTVSVDVAPPAEGVFTATLRTLGGCASVDFAVTGVPPVLACSVVPDSLDFGLIAVSTVVTDTVTVTNTGTVPLAGAATLPPGPFTVSAGGGDFTLAPGQSRDVVVAFAPGAVGTFTAALDLGADACVDVACRGAGREYGPYCVVVPEAVDGGEVPELIPVTFPVTVFNQGEMPLAVNAQIAAPGFSIVQGGGPRVVAPGAPAGDPGALRRARTGGVHGQPGSRHGVVHRRAHHGHGARGERELRVGCRQSLRFRQPRRRINHHAHHLVPEHRRGRPDGPDLRAHRRRLCHRVRRRPRDRCPGRHAYPAGGLHPHRTRDDHGPAGAKRRLLRAPDPPRRGDRALAVVHRLPGAGRLRTDVRGQRALRLGAGRQRRAWDAGGLSGGRRRRVLRVLDHRLPASCSRCRRACRGPSPSPSRRWRRATTRACSASATRVAPPYRSRGRESRRSRSARSTPRCSISARSRSGTLPIGN